MAVDFEYTTFLENSLHVAKAGLAAIVSSSTEADYYTNWTSEVLTNPSDEEIFRAFINPGHAGIATAIEYYLSPLTVAGAVDSFKWWIKESGGSWVEILSITGVLSLQTGVYEVEKLLPAQIKLTVTAAASGISVRIGLSYPCSVKIIGTV